MLKAEQRDESLDFIKGVLIFFVIWGHILQKTNQSMIYESIWDNPVYKTIYTFHMPLFMSISGYLTFKSLQRRSGRVFIKHRLIPLLHTIIAWGTLHLLILLCVGKVGTLSGIVKSYTDGFWFIWAIIHCSILITLVDKLRNLRFYYVIFILMFGLSVISFVPSKTVFMYPFFLAGYLISAVNIKMKKHTYIVFFSLYIFTLVIMLSKTGSMDFNLRIHKETFFTVISLDLLRWWVGALGSITFFGALAWTYRLLYHTSVVRSISLFGRKTLQIYVLNVVLLEDVYGLILYPITIRATKCNILYLNPWLFNLILSPLFSIFFIGIALYVDKQINNIRLARKIMYGK